MKRIKAFTLVELLVVILIIGVLATLVILSLSSSVKKSKDARAIDSIKKVQTALSQIQSEQYGKSLTDITSLADYKVAGGAAINISTFVSTTTDKFFQSSPKDAADAAIKIHITGADTYNIFGTSTTTGKCFYVSESANNLTASPADKTCTDL